MTGRSSNNNYRQTARGGRGRQGNRRFNNDNSKKKSLNDYIFIVGSSSQASDYETTSEYLINHIKKNYEYGADIASAIKKEIEYDMKIHKPSIQTSTSTDTTVQNTENRQFDLEYRIEYDEYMKRKRTYDNNKLKAYALFWERCSKAMKNKIQNLQDFESNIEDNPIELMKKIKIHSINYQEDKYAIEIVVDALFNFLHTKQKEKENLSEYTKRFKVAREIFEEHLGGPLVIDKYMKKLSTYTTDQDKAKEEAFKHFQAYLFMINTDQNKYGSVLKRLKEQYSLKNDQYPKTITDAVHVLNQHKYDNSNELRNRRKHNDDDDKNNGENKNEILSLSFAQLEGRCYCCGKLGHKSPQCRHKDRNKSEWAINKIKNEEKISFLQSDLTKTTSNTNDDNKNITSDTESSEQNALQLFESMNTIKAWTGVHVNNSVLHQFAQAYDIRDWILLDTESSTTIFCYDKYVKDIRPSTTLLDMKTNGGPLYANERCIVKGFDMPAWFNDKSLTNIISFAEATDRFRIIYDNKDKDIFKVHVKDHVINFKRATNNLYYYRPEKEDELNCFLNTLEENKDFYTERQFKKAKETRMWLEAMGNPSIKDAHAIIRMNLIRNCPINSADIKLTEEIFGPDVATLKGKTTRKTPLPVIENYIEVPRELISAQKNVTIAMDDAYVNSLLILTSISLYLYYRSAHYIPKGTMIYHEQAIDDIMSIYRKGGFIVREIRCDNAFRPLVNNVEKKYPFLNFNFSNPQEHVPQAERNIRVMKERIRVQYHRLPYNHLCRTLVKYLVTESMKKLNFLPAKHGISKYYSPRMIMHKQHLDYNQHCKYSIGQYVLAHDEPNIKNTNQARALDCIYLRYHAAHQGGHELWHIATNRVITRQYVTMIPITPSVIQQVHLWAEREGMPKGLKIESKTGKRLYDSTWLAGVDYDAQAFEEEDDIYDDDYIDNQNQHDIDIVRDDDSLGDNLYDTINDEELQELGEITDQNHKKDQNENNENNKENNEEKDDQNNLDLTNRETDEDGEDDGNNEDDSNDEGSNKIENEPRNIENKQKYEEIIDPARTITRAGRVSKPAPRINAMQLYQFFDQYATENNVLEYNDSEARIVTMIMCHLVAKGQVAFQFIQQYGLKKGIKKIWKSR